MSQSDLLKNWKNRAAPTKPAAFPRLPEGQVPLASEGQRRLFLLQQLYPDNPFYQYGHRYDFSGPLEEDLLAESYVWLIERHESLRTNFVAKGGEIEMVIHQTARIGLEVCSLTDEPEADRTEKAEGLTRAFFSEAFELDKEDLLRARLIHLSETEHRLLLSMHHIVGDRGSLQLMENEFFGHYTQLVEGKTEDVPPLRVQFKDLAYREQTRTVKEEHYDYWRKQLAGELPVINLPHDRERPAVPTYAGSLLEAIIGPETASGITALARKHGTTPNVVFLAALNAFLYRYTGQQDILVGSPVSIRDHKEMERLVGFLNETVVLRSTVSGQQGFGELIAATRTTMEAALERKDVSFGWLVDELQPERRGGVPPFFQTMFVYNAAAVEHRLPEGLSLHDEPVQLGTSKFDLTLFVTDTAPTFRIGLEYSRDLFQEDTVAAMLANFGQLLDALVAAPDEAVGTRQLLHPEQENWLAGQNPTFPPEEPASRRPLPNLFLDRAYESPEALAITDGERAYSYADIELHSGHLAKDLLDAGFTVGSPVGFYCGRTPELLIGILGIQRAGGAYVPLDPDYPQERINYITKDSGARFIVFPEGLDPVLPDGTKGITIRTDRKHPAKAMLPQVYDGNAYLIYTSGSTGKPKGIAVTHNNLICSTHARFRFYDQQPEAFLLLSSFAFDSSVAGIFWTMAHGGKLVLSKKRAEQDPAGLGQLIHQEAITHTLMLPSLYQLLLDYAPKTNLRSLQVVMVAGEACPSELVNTHFATLPEATLVNEYGPTEGTVWSTAHIIEQADAKGRVPIGRPVYGMGHYVLDENGQQVPPGVAGELCLSGEQLVPGYHGQPALTAETFLPNPYAKGHRLYRTGDLVRYRRNGLIDFLGRRDEQVKIRGHRIELTEISRTLKTIAGVKDAVVLALPKDKELQLVAYFTGDQSGVTGAQISPLLREQLPAYMIPAAFVELDAFPSLPNGKVNRKQLPPPEWEQRPSGEYEAPNGELEEQLAGLWRKTLKLDRVGRHDNFFDLGGDSLRSIRVIAGAKQLGLRIGPEHLFNHQTIAELAAVLTALPTSTASSDRAPNNAILLRKGGPKPPLFCLHSGGGHVFFYRPLAEALSGDRPVYAVQPKGLDGGEALPESMEAMAAEYIEAIREVQPHGPYLLLGSCFSNALAVEMATQLRAADEELFPLLIVDSGTGTFMRPDDDLNTGNKLTNLWRMVRRGRWDKIARRFKVRSILGYRQVASQLDEQRRNLYGTIGQLNDIYAAYEWPAYPGKIFLIRSSQFAGRKDKDHHLTRWQALAAKVDVTVTPGEHLTIFEAPAVTGLAKSIDEYLP